jgi:hypothetical protein
MSKHLWFDHCVQLAALLNGTMMRNHRDRDELRSRLQIKLSCKEWDQLRYEMANMPQFAQPDAIEADKINLLGVAFVPDSDDYIRELRLSLGKAEMRNRCLENIIAMGNRIARNRRGVGRGVHLKETHQPGTNRGGPA